MSSQVSVYMSSQQSISAGAEARVELNTELYDDENEYNTSSYEFVAAVAGRYLVNYQVRFQVTTTDSGCSVRLYTGTGSTLRGTNDVQAVTNDDLCITGSRVVELTVGEKIVLEAYSDSDNTLEGGINDTFMTITRLGDIP